MPSRKPRIALTVPDQLNESLDKLSDLTGTPKTKLIIDILEQSAPVFEQMILALEQIKQSKENSPALLKQFAQDMILDSQEKLGIIASEARKL
jgi:predicted DNA-binding protein